MTYKIVIAGSSKYSLLIAKKFHKNPYFNLVAIITPAPKPSGKDHFLIENPLLAWAKANHLNLHLVDKKIEKSNLEYLLASKIDFLLVVDFGYFISNWMLRWPKFGALNIHPSDLPRWRGSAPAVGALLSGQKTSATSLIKMNHNIDQGPIVTQHFFNVGPDWTQTEYYDHAFAISAQKLVSDLLDYAQGKIKPIDQPIASPTPLIQKMSKETTFINWSHLLISIKHLENSSQTNNQTIANTLKIQRAVRAYQPWPGLWTILPTKKGPKRMKILKVAINKQNQLVLNQVQIEGQKPAAWNQVKNILSDNQ